MDKPLPRGCKYTVFKDDKELPTIFGLNLQLEAETYGGEPCMYCEEVSCFVREHDYLLDEIMDEIEALKDVETDNEATKNPEDNESWQRIYDLNRCFCQLKGI